MRLTLYYCFHAFINQIKKLMKTWVLIFILICMGMGVAVGVIAASVSEKAEEGEPASEEMMSEQEEAAAAAEEETLAQRIGVEKDQLIEAACGLAAMLILLLMALNADKRGSAIFLRADSILLFASPMKPQSVLMFRLVVQMLTIVIIACLYLPNVILNMGMSVGMGCLVVVDFIFLFCLGLMVEMLLYCLSSTHPKLKDSIKRIVYGTLILIAGGFLLYYKKSGEGALKAAVRFLCAPEGRWIPLWGWVKGFMGAAMEGNLAMTVLFGLLTMLSLGGLIYLVWHVKADFYESALAKSEETAALLEKQQESKSLVAAVKKKKDREDDLKRDGLTRGWGASVLFHKNMYNRFRFAHFQVLTKGMELCMAAAIVTQLLARFVFKTDSFMPLVAVLGVLAFYKTLNSPLEQDTAMDFFLMIPESPWKKLAWSLLADVCCCAMDLLPALILGILIGGLKPLSTLMWLPFLVSIDVYGAMVGTFFAHAIPTFVDAKVKQLFQIIFVEFGLVPIALIMIFGVVSDRILMAAVTSTLVNLALAGVVFGVTPLIIDPATRK